ncbi:MAG: DUF1236 domain-containing protein [Rhizobiaceae bacterium]
MFVRKSLVLAGILALSSAGTAFAQTVILQPEEEVIVREYVVKQPRPEVMIPDDFDIVVGAELPDTVTVTPLDAPGFAREYEYIVVDGQTVLVEPDTRRIVKVLD